VYEVIQETALLSSSNLNFAADICVYACANVIYVQFFGFSLDEHVKVNPDFDFSCFEDFHYQDQADPPDDIPEDVYNARRIIWERIFESSYRPSRAGMVYSLIDKFELMEIGKSIAAKRGMLNKEYYNLLREYD